jgi:hypothetical protein
MDGSKNYWAQTVACQIASPQREPAAQDWGHFRRNPNLRKAHRKHRRAVSKRRLTDRRFHAVKPMNLDKNPTTGQAAHASIFWLAAEAGFQGGGVFALEQMADGQQAGSCGGGEERVALPGGLHGRVEAPGGQGLEAAGAVGLPGENRAAEEGQVGAAAAADV